MPEREGISNAVFHATPTVEIDTRGVATALSLKSWLPEHLARAMSATLGGRRLPSKVGATEHGAAQSLCVGPGEWLVVSNEQVSPALQVQFAAELLEQGIAIVDLTDGLAQLSVRGPLTREVLSQGCGLDLHPRAFPLGYCARTRFACIPVVLGCLDGFAHFEIYVARSYSRYLHSWLSDAASGFGAAVNGDKPR